MEMLHIAALFDNICRPNTLKLDKLAKYTSFVDFRMKVRTNRKSR